MQAVRAFDDRTRKLDNHSIGRPTARHRGLSRRGPHSMSYARLQRDIDHRFNNSLSYDFAHYLRLAGVVKRLAPRKLHPLRQPPESQKTFQALGTDGLTPLPPHGRTRAINVLLACHNQVKFRRALDKLFILYSRTGMRGRRRGPHDDPVPVRSPCSRRACALRDPVGCPRRRPMYCASVRRGTLRVDGAARRFSIRVGACGGISDVGAVT